MVACKPVAQEDMDHMEAKEAREVAMVNREVAMVTKEASEVDTRANLIQQLATAEAADMAVVNNSRVDLEVVKVAE